MARINIDDYKTDNGVDWKAYRAAEKEAGQICIRCESQIFYPLLTEGTGGKRLCGNCKYMVEEKGEVSHDTDLRCPKCGFLMSANDYDLWECGIWEGGEHEIRCVGCGHEFTVTTNTSHSFDSPAREA